MPIRSLPPQNAQGNTDNWAIRRRWLRISVIGIGINAQSVLVYTLLHDSGTGVQIFFTLMGALMSLLVAYIFGAIWDDHNKRKFGWSPMNEAQPDEGDEEATEVSVKTTTNNDDGLFLPTPGARKDSSE